MVLTFVEPQVEYAKNSGLKPDHVKLFMNWASLQPHLPPITEIQAILFLQSCFFSHEAAKTTLDTFFTVKTLCSDLFLNRDPLGGFLKKNMEVVVQVVLPENTPDGNSVFYLKFMDLNPNNFDFGAQIKIFDMVFMKHLYENGTSNGHIIVVDLENIVFGHVTKLGLLNMKKILYYLQDAMPIRLKSLHFINIVPFMDKILALMRPFMKKELMDMLYLHDTVDGLLDFIPRKCLPLELGGNAKSISTLHQKMMSDLLESTELYAWENSLLVDESKRPGKPKNMGDVFGVEGTFKKLELD